MYSLDVNFLKDRKLDESTKAAPIRGATPISWRKQTPLLIGLGIGAALMGLTALLGIMLNWQKAKTEANIKQLDAEISQLQAKGQSLAEMEAKVKAIDEEVTALVTVFNQIKPRSAVLQEIRRRTPPTVQVVTIEESAIAPTAEEGGTQPKVQLLLTGYARSYDDVNKFLLSLQNSEFFTASKTRIQGARQEGSPINLDTTGANLETRKIKLEIPEAVQYTITTQLSDIPASKLLPSLARNGAVGLVTRIKTLEQKGAVQP
ncbi:pilus assembly protein [Aphanothece hegewaldii CCALA 016]|uniref:Pilus assembly protein n=1 Tax=Aphanothece hegewaldii CCALA 016 TaxID=2107694 RepID=A0A2T1M3H3_9CHRO|nr:PilN domain-containing protein [Aphanothece hegewaldii]PSF39362.1 pilus assembly protein [Aphanothece hegewaldii CCALA 016]